MNIKQILRIIKRLPLYALFGRWRTQSEFEPGYTIALPMPMDMPFLLRLALEGLSSLNTPNCKQILVVPDGWGNDNGHALAKVIADFPDPRLQLVRLRPLDYRVIRAMRPPGCACTHWMLVVNSVLNARHEYVFLHDADAFFLAAEGLETQYREAITQGMDVLGVTPRWDPFFVEQNMRIAGTWEMLFSAKWARRRSPMTLFPTTRSTHLGDFGFDSMLFAQFLDHHKGTIGVMKTPPDFVHFNGTIFTYRTFRDRNNKSVTDELFRILLLSILETALHVGNENRVTPYSHELAAGLTDSNAPVRYDSEVNERGYPEFRNMISQMTQSPAFRGDRGHKILSLLTPFDAHFQYDAGKPFAAAIAHGQVREMGLGESNEN
jgi:hypothetical protein